MRSTSYTWRKLVENGEFHMQTVARIYGATGDDSSAVSGSDSRGSYREYAAITAPNITHGLLHGNALSIGNCVSGTLNFTVKTTDTIPKSAKIVIRSRVTNGNPDNLEYSEYLEFGTYWVDHRSYNDDYIDLECYDAMKMANQYCDYSIFGYDDWPKTVSFVVTNIAIQMGITVDSRTVSYFNEIGVWNQKIVSIPNGDDTLIKILGYIGGIIGGNWYVTYDNKLRYIPLISAPVGGHILSHTYDTITTDQGDSLIWGTIFEATETERGHITSHIDERIVAANGDYVVYDELGTAYKVNNPGGGGCVVVPVVVGSLTTANLVTVTKVTISVDTETSYSYGVNDGFEINVQNNPYADDSRVKDLYDRIKGLVYQPFNATNSVYDPAAELGDWVIVGDIVRGILYSESIKLDVGFSADISAPGEDELESEYPFVTIEERVTQSIEKTAVEIKRDTKSAVENATSQITGADGGYVRFMYDDDHNFNEILIMDNYDVSTASKVWRWNRGGLGYSSNGYNGPYGLAITQDGSIVADYINTGTLDADKVNVEHLKANKITSGILGVGDGKVTIDGLLTDSSRTNYWNLTDGTFQIKGTADGDVAAIRVTKGSDGKTTATINASKITAGTLNAQNITISNLDKNEANKSQIVSIADGVIKTAELKSTAGNDNYWNLVTGEFKIKAKSANTNAIYVKDGNVTINADNITTGTLKTVNNANNYWNLYNGLFKVQGSNDSAAAIEVGSDGKAKINASSITVGTINAAQIGDKSISNAKLSGSATGGIDNSWSLNFNTGAFTIGKITANSVVTGEIKNNGNRYNYWNLDSGDFRVGGSDSNNDYGIKVTRSGTAPNYIWTTNINADKLTIGTIQDTKKWNYWKLGTGEFRIGKDNTNYAILVDSSGNAKINASSITVGTINAAQIGDKSISNAKLSGSATGGIDNSWSLNFNTGAFTIGKITANSVVTGEIKNNGNRYNYWNLDSGDFRVGGSDSNDYGIKVTRSGTEPNYIWTTNINADKLTIGTIQAKAKQGQTVNTFNKWNLATGELKVGKSDTDYAIWVKQDGDAIINANKITTGIFEAGTNDVKITGLLRTGDDDKTNYWNLKTGDFQIKGSADTVPAIKVSGGVASINANTITAGIIRDKKKHNYWDLINGTIRIGGTSESDDSNYAIKVDVNGKASINASAITAGSITIGKFSSSALSRLTSKDDVTQLLPNAIKTMKIQSQDNKCYWNLATGAFKLSTKASTSSSDETQGIDTTYDAIKVSVKEDEDGKYSIDKVEINASKITTGTLSVDRIANIPASKLNSATLNNNWSINFKTGTINIGDISANNITSGTISTQYLDVAGIISAGKATIKELISTGEIKVDNASVKNGVSASLIKTGTLELGGSNNVALIMEDGSGNEIGRWDKDGLQVNKGGFQLYDTQSEFISGAQNGKCMALRAGALQVVSSSNVNTIYGSIGYYGSPSAVATKRGVQIKSGSKTSAGTLFIGGNVTIENLKAVKTSSGSGSGSTGKTTTVTIKKGMSSKTLSFRNGILISA